MTYNHISHPLPYHHGPTNQQQRGPGCGCSHVWSNPHLYARENNMYMGNPPHNRGQPSLAGFSMASPYLSPATEQTAPTSSPCVEIASTAIIAQDDSHDETSSCIFADLLIPGRGNPMSDMAVGISRQSGKITFVESQSRLPSALNSLPRTHVRYLLPGLWDCHSHFAGILHVDFPDFIQTHPAVCGAANARSFHDTLMAGFTSVRDCGSYATEVARVATAGVILGPNVFGAGAAIGITGGSCDATTLPADFVYSRQGTGADNFWPGVSTLAIADGVEQCRQAVRQQVRRGAKCIKIVATGGVLSTTDDPHCRQFSDGELRVMVEEAALQGRAVAIHAHGKAGIMAAIRVGAKTIEHGSFIDEEAAEQMAKHDVMLVATRHVIEAGLKNLEELNPETAEKMVMVADAHLRGYSIAIKKGVKIALGTDIASSDPQSETSHGKNGAEVVYAVKAGLSPLQAIEAGTINSAETLGPQTPKKGLLKPGWDADMIAFDENPLENVSVFAEPDNVKYVWQGGKLAKSPGWKALWPSDCK
ncbi:Metal-dependent hydrolase, composite domain superfamily [Fusarium oxysporum f. sp. vasinfectum]|nr:Metal-dependent hydrolase, composite domain superfamily [Fusarium oxysporum f. sp. vasinfectum]